MFDTRLLSFSSRHLEPLYAKQVKLSEPAFLDKVRVLVDNYTNVEYWWCLRHNLLTTFNQPFPEIQDHLAVVARGRTDP